MAKLPANIPDCSIFLLAKAYQRAHGLFKKKLKPHKITNMQHLVLEGLWYQQGISAADLGKLLILDKATLSGILDRMEESGWIRKETDPEDGRMVKLYTSEMADSLKNTLIQLRVETNEEMLSVFSSEEEILLKRFLRDLI